MRDHSRSRCNKKSVGYRTPSRFKANNPQAEHRQFDHLDRPAGRRSGKGVGKFGR